MTFSLLGPSHQVDFRAILTCFKAQDLCCLRSLERRERERSDFQLENRIQQPMIRRETVTSIKQWLKIQDLSSQQKQQVALSTSQLRVPQGWWYWRDNCLSNCDSKTCWYQMWPKRNKGQACCDKNKCSAIRFNKSMVPCKPSKQYRVCRNIAATSTISGTCGKAVEGQEEA